MNTLLAQLLSSQAIREPGWQLAPCPASRAASPRRTVSAP